MTKIFAILCLLVSLWLLILNAQLYGPGFRYRTNLHRISTAINKGDLEKAKAAIKSGSEDAIKIEFYDQVRLVFSLVGGLIVFTSAFMLMKAQLKGKDSNANTAGPNA